MPNCKNSRSKSNLFVDFKPAELRQNKDWMIVFYAKNPLTNTLEIQRLRVPAMKNSVERLKHGKRIVLEINNKLATGWSPYFEESGKNFKSFNEAIAEFLKFIKKQITDNVCRPDTLRTYSSNINIIKEFIEFKKLKITFALEINRNFCNQYLDYIYLDRGNSPVTRNNHLFFLKLYCNFLVSRGVLSENPAVGILTLKTPEKIRQVLPEIIKQKITKELETNDYGGYNALCMTTYYCFIRNSELKKLKVGSVNLMENSIFISKNISKNKKDETVTIPSVFLPLIANHIKNANPDDLLFSKNNFKPGKQILASNAIANEWDKIRTKLKFDKKYQFYSLKDTGITDLLNSGVPAIKVRDQARHSEIKITEIYTPRNKGCDEVVKNANVNF